MPQTFSATARRNFHREIEGLAKFPEIYESFKRIYFLATGVSFDAPLPDIDTGFPSFIERSLPERDR